MKRYIVGRRAVLAHASAISKVRSDLQNHTDQIEENFIKLLLTPTSCPTRNHWRQEIANQVARVKKLDNTKRFPTADQIYQWMYTDALDDLTDIQYMSNIIENICEIENIVLEDDFDIRGFIEVLLNYLSDYYKWLALQLSEKGVARRSDVFEKLVELF